MEQVTALADAFVRNDAEIEAAAARTARRRRAARGVRRHSRRPRVPSILHLPLRGAGDATNTRPGFPMDFGASLTSQTSTPSRALHASLLGAWLSWPADWSLRSRTPDLRPLITGMARLRPQHPCRRFASKYRPI